MERNFALIDLSDSSFSTNSVVLSGSSNLDSNTIHVRAIPNKETKSIISAFKSVYQDLVQAGCKPKLQKYDNECSTALKEYLNDEQTKVELVPPYDHRRNKAERAIRTFKNHFIAALCSTDSNFPMYLWDSLVPQAEITLNLLRKSCINPNLSGHEQIYGRYDFNKHPMAPPGTRVLLHERPNQRGSWSPHAIDAWCIGPTLDHYRCYRVHVVSTGAE